MNKLLGTEFIDLLITCKRIICTIWLHLKREKWQKCFRSV